MRVSLTVKVSFDLDELNKALGNTPNVDSKKALKEYFESATEDWGRYDSYGDINKDAPHLEKSMTFTIYD